MRPILTSTFFTGSGALGAGAALKGVGAGVTGAGAGSAALGCGHAGQGADAYERELRTCTCRCLAPVAPTEGATVLTLPRIGRCSWDMPAPAWTLPFRQ